MVSGFLQVLIVVYLLLGTSTRKVQAHHAMSKICCPFCCYTSFDECYGDSNFKGSKHSTLLDDTATESFMGPSPFSYPSLSYLNQALRIC